MAIVALLLYAYALLALWQAHEHGSEVPSVSSTRRFLAQNVVSYNPYAVAAKRLSVGGLLRGIDRHAIQSAAVAVSDATGIRSVPGVSTLDAAAVATAASDPTRLFAALEQPVVVAEMTNHFFGPRFDRSVPCTYSGRPLQCTFIKSSTAAADVLW